MNYLDIFFIAIISYLGGMITMSIWQWLFGECHHGEWSQYTDDDDNKYYICSKCQKIMWVDKII